MWLWTEDGQVPGVVDSFEKHDEWKAYRGGLVLNIKVAPPGCASRAHECCTPHCPGGPPPLLAPLGRPEVGAVQKHADLGQPTGHGSNQQRTLAGIRFGHWHPGTAVYPEPVRLAGQGGGVVRPLTREPERPGTGPHGPAAADQFTWNVLSPFSKKLTIWRAAARPALMLASAVCAPIFLEVKQ